MTTWARAIYFSFVMRFMRIDAHQQKSAHGQPYPPHHHHNHHHPHQGMGKCQQTWMGSVEMHGITLISFAHGEDYNSHLHCSSRITVLPLFSSSCITIHSSWITVPVHTVVSYDYRSRLILKAWHSEQVADSVTLTLQLWIASPDWPIVASSC